MTGRDIPLALVVFAYNEVDNVPGVLSEILDWLRGRGGDYELLFVDDGSTDGTGAVARRVMGDDPRCAVLRHEQNRGIGAAIKTGYAASTLPWVTFLPCDGQILPGELDALCDATRAGVRVVYSVYRARADGLHRKVLSAGVRGLIRAVHGITMRCDGPYLFRRELFDPTALVPDTFFLNFEFPIRMQRAREPYVTVTIECVPRRQGQSKSTGLRRIAGVGRDLVDLRLRLWGLR